MLDAGVPVRDVADMVGHRDTRTTSIYTHGNEERRREAAMVMDGLVAGESLRRLEGAFAPTERDSLGPVGSGPPP